MLINSRPILIQNLQYRGIIVERRRQPLGVACRRWEEEMGGVKIDK